MTISKDWIISGGQRYTADIGIVSKKVVTLGLGKKGTDKPWRIVYTDKKGATWIYHGTVGAQDVDAKTWTSEAEAQWFLDRLAGGRGWRKCFEIMARKSA